MTLRDYWQAAQRARAAELMAEVEAIRAADAEREQAARRHWLAWTPDEFDGAAKPVQGALFAEPDRMGTPDMFADQS
jgi:hypothetical protein